VTSTTGQATGTEADLGKAIEVTRADLPLSCPMPGRRLWSSHPRVYLAVEKTGWAKCPYCSTEYILRD
jgi:uncharacterized Zn-finger protein